MARHSLTTLLAVLSLWACLTAAAPPALPTAADFQADARELDGRVLLVALTRHGCRYCEVLKGEVLAPMQRSGDYRDRVLMRELPLDSGNTVRDFHGRKVATEDFARRYDEWLTPTVLLLGPEGRELAPRLRGLSNLDFYGYYLDQAIEQAREAAGQGG